MSRSPDQLAREVRKGIYSHESVEMHSANRALAELQAQAEAGQRAARIYEGLRTDANDGTFALWREDDLVAALHAIPLAAAAPPPADTEAALTCDECGAAATFYGDGHYCCECARTLAEAAQEMDDEARAQAREP